MTFSTMRPAEPARVGSERPSALTTPAVTEPAKPSGLPIATTSWPTRSRSASPSSAGARSEAVMRMTARSESGSLPTTWKGNSRPSAKDAVPPSARWITCADVSAKPSGVMMTPEPAPSARRPPRRRCATRRLVTEGASRSATDVTIAE